MWTFLFSRTGFIGRSAFLLSVFSLLCSPSIAQTERVPVAVTKAVLGPVREELPLTGSVISPRAAVLSVAVEGLVEAVHVQAGSRVETDEKILILDSELSRIDLDRARAGFSQAQEATADAERRLQEALALEKQRNIPASEVRSLEAEVKIESANLQVAKAELNRAEEELARHTVTAPFEGVIHRKLTETGEWLSPGAAVAELVALEPLWLDFQVPQAYFSRIDEQTQSHVMFKSTDKERFDARILSKVPVSDPQARTFLLRLILENHPPAVTPGMSARAILSLASGEEGLLVPRDAIVRYPDGRVAVWIIKDADDTPVASERQVRLGLVFNGRAEIRSGLSAGQRVVVRGNESLTEGQAVTIEDTVEAAPLRYDGQASDSPSTH